MHLTKHMSLHAETKRRHTCYEGAQINYSSAIMPRKLKEEFSKKTYRKTYINTVSEAQSYKYALSLMP